MSDVLSDNYGWGATREPVHCHGVTSKSSFPTVQASSYAEHPSNALKLPGTTVCLPSDHVVQIHDGQCFYYQKTQSITPWSLTDLSVVLLVEETLSPYAWLSNWNVSVKFLLKSAAKFHTHMSSKLFHCHFITNLTGQLVRLLSSADVTRRLMLIVKRDKRQFVVKTWC